MHSLALGASLTGAPEAVGDDAPGAFSAGERYRPEARVLIVAVSGQESNPALLDAVSDRAVAGGVSFHLVLPDPAHHSEITSHQRQTNQERGEAILRIALPQLSSAAGCTVTGSVSARHDPMDAIEEMLRAEPFSEILLATTHHTLTERLHLDLPRRVAHLGLPVTTVIGEAVSG
jgi:hypothetical protein